jgi:hypothetical protein
MKYWITVIISCIIKIAFAGNIAANIDSIKNDSIYKMEMLKLEYTFYSSQSESEKFDALLSKVHLLLENKAYSKGMIEIKRIELLDKELLQQKQFYSNMEALLFQHAMYSSCLEIFEGDTIENYSLEKSFMKSLCLNRESQYESIKNEIRKAALLFNLDTTYVLNELLNYEVINTQKKSVLYQIFLPGAGMINEGEFSEGFTSFLMNGLFAGATIILAKQRFYSGAFSYGLMPFTKFYLGGLKHTRYLASKNEEKRVQTLMQKNAETLFKFYQR